MLQTLAAEAWGLNGADGPVETDRDAVTSFLVGVFDDAGSEEVEAAEMVLLPTLVEDAPAAALGHVLDGGEGVEVGDFGVVGHVGGYL